MKIPLAELFHADVRADRRIDGETDGWTNMRELIVAFRNFVNSTKNVL